MTEKEINDLVKENIYQAIEGMSKENYKFDFKRNWYDLSEEIQLNEFLKDISAMANTPGPDGFIVIGFDDKTKTFSPSLFSDSKLRDKNEIVGILIRRIDHAFDINVHDIEIDRNKLSVIHIPPSLNKPHFIKNYKTIKKAEEHRIFIRNDTTTKIAGRFDLERMLWDNKNIEQEFGFEISVNKKSIAFNYVPNNNENLEISMQGLTVENTGRRILAISKIEFHLIFNDNCDLKDLKFTNARMKSDKGFVAITQSKLIVEPYKIEEYMLKLYTNYVFDGDYSDVQKYKNNIINIKQIIAEITLTNNKKMSVGILLNE